MLSGYSRGSREITAQSGYSRRSRDIQGAVGILRYDEIGKIFEVQPDYSRRRRREIAVR